MKYTHTVVFSAWRSNQDLIENMEATKKARKHLTGLNLLHREGVGSFREQHSDNAAQEVVHIVMCNESDVMPLVNYAALEHNQECCLVVTRDDKAQLVAPFITKDIGTLTQVSKAEAKTSDCYTYFLGEYFICK